MARCRSRRESLRWSARRRSWVGDDVVAMLEVAWLESGGRKREMRWRGRYRQLCYDELVW